MTTSQIRERIQQAIHESRSYTELVNMLHAILKDDEKETLTISGISGLTPVDPVIVTEFRRMMTEEVIPEIIKTIERRQQAARQQLGHSNT